MSVDRSKWPLFVRWGLWGLPNRASAWAFFWLSVVLAVGCMALGLFVDYRFLIGGVFIYAAASYYAAIRWVDEHSSWS
jgi:hypothetical protein